MMPSPDPLARQETLDDVRSVRPDNMTTDPAGNAPGESDLEGALGDGDTVKMPAWRPPAPEISDNEGQETVRIAALGKDHPFDAAVNNGPATVKLPALDPAPAPAAPAQWPHHAEDQDTARVPAAPRTETAEAPVGGPASEAPLPAGMRLGDYTLVRMIGEGSMARVYEAEHSRIGRKVALKVLRSEAAKNATTVKRFIDEARAVNRVRHAGVVQVTDLVEFSDVAPFCVMELLEGEDLASLIERRGRVATSKLITIASAVAETVAALHTAGIVHRDLKPQNIFVGETGGHLRVTLLDLGTAKVTDESRGFTPAHETAQGTIVGTPAYMAPEQAVGQPADERVDVYALGVVMYEMATGRLPFEGNNLTELLFAQATTRPDHVNDTPGVDVPAELDELVLRCLSREPANRPANMRELANALDNLSLVAATWLG
jgi:tRNA A-37 threonylcarbamoyl transferase component Bud32